MSSPKYRRGRRVERRKAERAALREAKTLTVMWIPDAIRALARETGKPTS